MTPQQLEELERKWSSLRHKKLAEIIEMKLSVDQFPTDKLLAEMELERRKFVRDVMIDRFISGISIIIAFCALLLSLWSLLSQKFQTQSAAIPSTNIIVQTNSTANTVQSVTANK